MSKKKRISQIKLSDQNLKLPGKENKPFVLRRYWWAVGLMLFLSISMLGAALRYLEEDAKRQMLAGKQSGAANQQSGGLLNSVNPFLPTLSPTPTPQLSKEYIYAGSRLLAVEDTNASAAPPADLAVWRLTSGTGYWYVMGANGGLQTSGAWGTTGDVPVPGDYDGDGKTDFSVFRPSSGVWYVYNSSDGATQSISFGQNGDVTAPADYDGDGKTDAAVFRVSTGYWYIRKSSDAGTITQAFGTSGDEPVSTDFDGDGKADIAVWRDSSATFYYLKSSDNNSSGVSLAFGQTSDKPFPADYDGDGKADAAIRRGDTWHILQSSNNSSVSYQWGNTTDTPVPNDYDGDGKVDVAVWRGQSNNSNEIGAWYIRNSSTGQLRSEQWGIANDTPVPAFYRR